jgi:hypothetical protein
MESWVGRAARIGYEGAGIKPSDVDIFNPYDGYSPVMPISLEAFQWHGAQKGDAAGFFNGDISVHGPHPHCSGGGNLGVGRTRSAMYIEALPRPAAGISRVASTARAASPPGAATCAAASSHSVSCAAAGDEGPLDAGGAPPSPHALTSTAASSETNATPASRRGRMPSRSVVVMVSSPVPVVAALRHCASIILGACGAFGTH